MLPVRRVSDSPKLHAEAATNYSAARFQLAALLNQNGSPDILRENSLTGQLPPVSNLSLHRISSLFILHENVFEVKDILYYLHLIYILCVLRRGRSLTVSRYRKPCGTPAAPGHESRFPNKLPFSPCSHNIYELYHLCKQKCNLSFCP